MNESTTKFMTALMAAVILMLIIAPLAPLGAAELEVLPASLGTSPHSTINVNNDITLAALISSNGWSGNGTVGGPYIIQNLDIDAHGSPNAIFIGNTTAHLLIRNCHLYNTSLALGSIPFNANCGAAIYNAQNVILENNTCSGNRRGIALFSSSAIIVRNNTCFGNDHGIGVYTSTENVVENNSCSSNVNDGVHLEDSTYNTIQANSCYQNGRYGIALAGCSNNAVLGNKVYLSSNAGINLASDSNGNTIIDNDLTGNLGYGIRITGASDSNEIFGNALAGNRGATSVYDMARIQGFDDSSNQWSSATYGNLWGDWSEPDRNGDGVVDSPYALDGGSGSDRLPIATYDNVSISHPMEGAIIGTPTVIVTGMADPDYFLSINGAVVYVEENGSFSYVLSLLEGSTQIEVRSLNPLNPVRDLVNITYVNELRTELEEMDRRITALNQSLSAAVGDLDSALESIETGLNQTNSVLDETKALLYQTREWLQEVDDELTACYDDHNLTAAELTSLIDQVSELRTSLIELSGSLNLTDEQAVVLQVYLNAAIADLASAEGHLQALQADINAVKNDQLPLILGATGFTLGLLALLLFVLVYTRKIKLP